MGTNLYYNTIPLLAYTGDVPCFWADWAFDLPACPNRKARLGWGV